MRSIRIAVMIVGFAAAFILKPESSNGEDRPEPRSKPLLVLTGAASQVKEAAYYRLSSADKLKDVWRGHLGAVQDRGDNPVPEVDFDRCVVLALFEGSSFNSHGLRIEAVLDRNDVTVVRFDDISYQTLGGGANTVAPYAFILLPKTDKVIVLEENVQQYLSGAPVWKEVSRLTASEK